MKHVIEFSGHKNVRSLHQRTIEITKDTELTISGDCIIGVNASGSCSDIPEPMKTKLRNPNCIVKFIIQVNGYEFTLHGKGHPDLILSDTEDIVIRKSDFVCSRTLAIKCDKASDSIPREIVSELQNPDTRGTLIIDV